MHKKKIERDPALGVMMGYVKKDLNRAVSLPEFTKWCQANPSILTPLRMLQLHLRFQIIGPNFWTQMTEQRRAHPEMGAMDYLPKLQKRVIAETKFFINQGLIDKDERRRMSRRGKGPNGDHRDNVTRKQSFLVNYFQLSRYSIQRGAAGKVVPATPVLHPGLATAPNSSAASGSGSEKAPTTAGSTKDKDRNNKESEKSEKNSPPKADSPVAAPAASSAGAPRRRRSSLLFTQRPILLIKSEMPVEIKQKKSSSKKRKKEDYKEAVIAETKQNQTNIC